MLTPDAYVHAQEVIGIRLEFLIMNQPLFPALTTISNELAASIQQAFSQYYTDLSNQDQIFFWVGEVTITKQDGTTVVVPSWSKAIGNASTVG